MQRRATQIPPAESRGPRVLMVSHGGDFGGGAEIMFRDMVLALREYRRSLDAIAVYPWAGPLAAHAARLGVRTRSARLPWWITGEQLTAIGILVRMVLLLVSIAQAVFHLLRLRPTTVITNTMVIPSYAVAAKLLGIPHYWMVDEFGKEDHRFTFLLGYRRTIGLIGRLSESVICISRAVEKALVTVAPTMKTRVLYPAIEDAPGTPVERQDGEVMRTVLVGRFKESKGQHLAIAAIAAAREAGVDMELTLIGPGDRRPAYEAARRLGVGDLVSCHGQTRDVGRYWSAAHVALMCSDAEAFGLVTVEAMRAGLPVCGTNSGATPEIVDAGVNGLLSAVGDADALAANLIALESDENLRHRLAVRAVQTSQRFRRDRYSDELARIIGLC
jgi:glycosyltransferase involved in cell wall biosynthesis